MTPEAAPAIVLKIADYWPQDGRRKLWTRKQLSRLLSVPYWTLAQWGKWRLIRSMGQAGPGQPLIFGELEVAAAAMVRDLLKIGLRPAACRGIAEAMRIENINAGLSKSQ